MASGNGVYVILCAVVCIILCLQRLLLHLEKFLPSDTEETCFLTSETVRYLMKQDRWRDDLPNLSKEEIESKSKAGGVAKALVCTQAL